MEKKEKHNILPDGDKVKKLTAAEIKAIKQLEKLAKTFPKTLWLFSASGTLCVMQYPKDGGSQMNRNHGVNKDYMVTTISGITNDGGDW